jgi:glucose/arabinose dehydrogenase
MGGLFCFYQYPIASCLFNTYLYNMNFSKQLLIAMLVCICTFSKLNVAYAQTYTLDSTTLVADTVITGLNVPWELKWGPDNYLWMTERDGIVSRVNPQTGLRTIILNASQSNGGPVYAVSESGLLSFVFHPAFPDSNYLYMVYTYLVAANIKERVVRYEYVADSLINPVTLIEDIAGANFHNGSRLAIGPDNKIYMTTGDGLTQPSAQDITSLNGKTLRLNLDGSIPGDNPIPGSPIWSWGHRNAQGLEFGPTGILYSSEHGPNNDDEINIIKPAGNYGWPTVMGICNLPQELTFCTDSNVVESIYQWTPTIAPGDLIYYNSPAIPEWQGTLLLSVMKNKRLLRLTLNSAGDSITSETSYFINQWGRLRDICAGPDGTIYLATNGATSGNIDPNTHSIIRLRNFSYPGILNIDTGNDTLVCVGSGIQLSPTINGGALPLNYNWSPSANLSCSNCVNPIASSITDTTIYVLTVTDNNGDTAIDSLTVNVLSLPGPISYTYTILDTFGNPAMVEININIPAADSVLVISSYYDTIGVFLNTQNITFIDSSGGVSCTIGDGDCWIDFDLWVYAYSACGFDSLYDYQQIIVDESSSIKHVYNTLFQVYPNPTDGKMTIAGLKPGDQISILNITGKKMIQFAASNDSESKTDLSNLPSGVYFIRVERDGQIGVQKLIKY